MKEYYAFNKQVTEDRVWEIRNYWNKIKGDFKLELKDNEWEDEWKKLPKEVWIKLAELPEFASEVVEKIIGFELDLDTSKNILISGKEFSEETIKKALKEYII